MSDTLVEDIENDIIFGVFAPGSRIVEDRIIEQYDAKRHAVRRAFAELESRGLLVHIPNRGVEVVQFTPDEVDALYDVRIVLEAAAAERTRLPADAGLIRHLEEIGAQHSEAIARQDFRAVFRLNQDFHRVQFSCCGNDRLAALIEKHARIAQPIRVIKYDDQDHMNTVIAQHEAIIDALRGHSTDAYVRATKEHLPASAETYRALYERRFGHARAAR